MEGDSFVARASYTEVGAREAVMRQASRREGLRTALVFLCSARTAANCEVRGRENKHARRHDVMSTTRNGSPGPVNRGKIRRSSA